MSVKIVTNYHVRPIIDASSLTATERANFDYLDWDALEAGEDSREFVRYRGDVIDLGDVMMAPDSIKRLGFDGFNSDSYWSGIAFRYFDVDGNLLDCGDGIIVARVLIDED